MLISGIKADYKTNLKIFTEHLFDQKNVIVKEIDGKQLTGREYKGVMMMAQWHNFVIYLKNEKQCFYGLLLLLGHVSIAFDFGKGLLLAYYNNKAIINLQLYQPFSPTLKLLKKQMPQNQRPY